MQMEIARKVEKGISPWEGDKREYSPGGLVVFSDYDIERQSDSVSVFNAFLLPHISLHG